MIITGVAPKLWEADSNPTAPSEDLIYLVKRYLRSKKASYVFTGLTSSLDFALAIGSIEYQIPFATVVPYQGFERPMDRDARLRCHWVMHRSNHVEVFSDSPQKSPTLNNRYKWMIDQADLVLALWGYEDHGLVYQMIKYALRRGIKVTNLEEDWNILQEPWPQKTDTPSKQ